MTIPHVTLLILSYNQQQFVADATAAAFAQDHPRLQIVFSDDSSSDDTHARLTAAVASYRGPHTVLVNSTARNRGILGHLYEAVRLATGDLVVLGAADDISYPSRVSRLAALWRETGADALCSGYDAIDADGRVIDRNCTYDFERSSLRDYFPRQTITPIHGATSAYRREVFTHIHEPIRALMFEDSFFTLMLHLRSRRVAHTSEALVAYRQHGEAITNAVYSQTDVASVTARERRSERVAGWIADVLDIFAEAARTATGYEPGWGAPATIDTHALAADTAFLRWRARWLDASLRERLAALGLARTRQDMRWLLPRLFGPTGLAFSKRVRAWARG